MFLEVSDVPARASSARSEMFAAVSFVVVAIVVVVAAVVVVGLAAVVVSTIKSPSSPEIISSMFYTELINSNYLLSIVLML